LAKTSISNSKLTYLRESDAPRKAWYRCECGREKEIRISHVNSGATKTCGECERENHRMCRTVIYNRWCAMNSRCYLPGGTGFHKYGKRGIGVCKRWRESFVAFYEDMGSPPAGTTIGRIDNDWHYEPSNCRWETPKQQANNRRSSRIITAFGKTQTLQQWADECGISYVTILYRVKRGWTIEDALTRKPNYRNNH